MRGALRWPAAKALGARRLCVKSSLFFAYRASQCERGLSFARSFVLPVKNFRFSVICFIFEIQLLKFFVFARFFLKLMKSTENRNAMNLLYLYSAEPFLAWLPNFRTKT